MNPWGGRDEIRRVFFRAWQRHVAGQPLEGVEAQIVAVALEHPEYHGVLGNPDDNHARDYVPESGQGNPFAHMGMHIALREQISMGHPPGMRELHDRLAHRLGDSHAAEHRLMDCLIEAMWAASRGEAPESVMAQCIERMQETEGLTPSS